jgi:hypothetical protein
VNILWIVFGFSVALSTWGQAPPPCGAVSVGFENLHGQLAGYADPSRCKIVFDKHPWTPWTKARTCKVIVHEKGHLYGRQHSKNPGSIMYPRLHYWRPCER